MFQASSDEVVDKVSSFLERFRAEYFEMSAMKISQFFTYYFKLTRLV